MTGDYIRRLCVALEYRWKPKRWFVIFTAYFDESGTHDPEPAIVMAGYLGNGRQWQLFHRRIKRLQYRDGFKIFHAKDLRKSAGEFKGWSEFKRARLISDLTLLVRDTLTKGVTVSLDKERYKREYRETPTPRKMILDSAYGLCFRSALSHLIRDLYAQKHVLHIVMEDGARNVNDACRIFKEIKAELCELGIELLGDITLADKQKCMPLMVADFLAHTQLLVGRAEAAGLPGYPAGKAPRGQAAWDHLELRSGSYGKLKANFQKGIQKKADEWRARRDAKKAVSSSGPSEEQSS